ncbi:class III lanthionine synthetase LanKC [Pseudoalteromonas sp. R3]|uniref:class III lanthionine synthetase LanKC n=1 Tax=Pseudoalteromonas sp. R3 TaxID=1709477 RepID=UPI0006B43335|nr:class III lanthionine synthetase LanKC [Pseudoalteromonas sp. R3]AZZ99940.1 hypothetical protein ELR70_24440 [Pseudoalteromonas sp. R3]
MYNNSYMLGDNEYFTQPAIMKPDEAIAQAVSSTVPESWSTKHHSIWLSATPSYQQLPEQGFKIHVSASTEDALSIIRATLQQCIEFDTSFKVICRQDIANQMASKATGRGSSGKLITIYPRSVSIFKQLIQAIYEVTKEFNGPYILSDKRYKDSKVVYYRYGGFKLLPQQKADGSQVACIKKPDGTLIKDEREAFYKLPEWIQEPFKLTDSSDESIAPLNDRYEVIEALSFSNSGGVYKAKDLQTSQTVVVKEARPYVHFSSVADQGAIYADQVLQNEFSVIKTLSSSRYFPTAIDWFTEWEHSFLVEEYIDGTPLRNYRGKKEVTLVPFVADVASAERFQQHFIWIARETIAAVTEAHQRGVVLGDVSPNNILVDEQAKTIRFIDFEGAYHPEQNAQMQRALLTTPGFSNEGFMDTGATYKGDWFALAMALYSMIFPALHIFSLAPEKRWQLLHKLQNDCALNPHLTEVIQKLADGEPEQAKSALVKLAETANPQIANTSAHFITALPDYDQHPVANAKDFALRVNKIAAFISQGIKTNIDPHFMPIDYTAFDVHPLALTYGYYGPAVFMAKTGHDVPAHLLEKIADFETQTSTAGLFVGYAGMALAELELDREVQAKRWADYALDSMSKFDAVSFAHGLAGVGYMCLKLYTRYHDAVYLEHAGSIAQQLQLRACDTEHGCYFPVAEDEETPVGFAHGSAGVALFLLYLAKLTHNTTTLEFAKAALAHDIQAGLTAEGEYKWGKTVDSKTVLPYWEHGAAGIGAVVIRFYRETGDASYLELAQSIALSAYSRYSVDQGQFIGVSGIVEFFIDLYQITENTHYRQVACEISERLTLFSIDRQQGEIYPSRHSVRLSADYAFGSSGIGMMLHRLATGGHRFMHDL